MANAIEYQTAWLLLNDETFLKQNSGVTPDIYPPGPLRYLVRMALNNWASRHAMTTAKVVDILADAVPRDLRKDNIKKQEALDVLDLLNDGYDMTPGEIAIVRPQARAWLERKQMAFAVDKATPFIDAGNLDKAKSYLSFGALNDNLEEASATLDFNSKDFLKGVKQIKPGAIPTGFYELDIIWEGGHRPAELGMVCGATGTGKSMVHCFMAAKAMWAGTDVLYYTTELTVDQIKERVALAMLQKGKLDLKLRWRKEIAAKAQLEGVNLSTLGSLEVRMRNMGIAELEQELEEYKTEHGHYPGLLLLDSPDDFGALDTKKSSNYEILRDTYTFLRRLALEKDLHVWTTGQLNRTAVEAARVSLKMIGDSFAKAQRCHYVLGFSQTDAEAGGRKDDDPRPGHGKAKFQPKMSLYILKDSLHGTNGVWFELDIEYGRAVGGNGYPGFAIKKAHNTTVVRSFAEE